MTPSAPPTDQRAPSPASDTSDRGLRGPFNTRVITAQLILALLIAGGVWSLIDLRVNPATLVDGYGNALAFFERVLPLTLPPWGELARQVGITLSVVLLATLLSVILSVPLAVWAASNTQRGTASRISARGVIVVARAVPDIVLAIVFLRFFGLGALPGVLAMGLHSVGMVGRLFADSIEQIDNGPREALQAAGASRVQQIVSGVLPQVLPSFVAIALHRFDINLRISALLGYVGVAGIGLEMSYAFARLDFSTGLSWALVLVVLCVLVELVSTGLRRSLLGEGPAFERLNRHSILARTAVRHPRSGSVGGTHSPPSASAPVSHRVSPAWTPHRLRKYVYVALCAGALVWSIGGSGVLDTRSAVGWDEVVQTLSLFWPHGFPTAAEAIVEALAVTVKIALAATLLGAVLALPLGSLAARNVAPNRAVYLWARAVILSVRGMPELIVAVLFIVVIGLGPVAGTLALAIGAVGLLGKLVADSIEEAPPGPALAMRAAGASRTQVYFVAVLPQMAPAVVGHVLYQLDVNVRAATLLGIVGGGGVGFYLLQATQTREYEVVTVIMVLVFAVVMLVELISLVLRRLLR